MDQSILKIAMGKLAKNKYIAVDKKSKVIKLTDEAINNKDKLSVDKTKDILHKIKLNSEEFEDTEVDQQFLDEMKKSKLVTQSTIKCCKVIKGAD